MAPLPTTPNRDPLLSDSKPRSQLGKFFRCWDECAGSRHGFGLLWGAVFNLSTATLGAGSLALPHAFQQMGLVLAVTFCILTAMASHLANMLLADCLEATGVASFEDLAEVAFGRWNRRAIGASVFVISFGSAVAYTIALGDILQPFIDVFAATHSMPWLTRDLCLSAFWVVIMLPLSLVKDVSQLRFTSLFAVLALIYLAIAMGVHFGIDASIMPSKTIGEVRLIEFGHYSMGTASSISLIIFSFDGQMNVPSIYSELRTPYKTRVMTAVSSRAMAICALCYIAIGFVGYANFPHSSQGDLLNNYCLHTPSLTSYSAHMPSIMTSAALAIALQLLMAYPVNLYPGRDTLDLAFFSQCGRRHKQLRHVGLTFFMAAPSLALALVLPDISVVFGVLGGTANVYLCFVMPALIAWRLRHRTVLLRSRCGRASCLLLAGAGAAFGILSTAATVLDLLDGVPDSGGACDVNQTLALARL